jgi:aspartate aminotransferase-like enzyme
MFCENDHLQASSDIAFKIATEPWEFEAIHRLNYKTFVEEIPQHAENAAQRLVDRFHAENTYCICVQSKQLLAMVCLRSVRPFSLDLKLPNLDELLPAGKSVCEIRLLAVEPAVRHGRVTLQLFQLLARQAIEQGYDLGIMSGTTRQMKLYARLGFVSFGPLVGKGDAMYQPMYLSLPTFLSQTLLRLKLSTEQSVAMVPANFLPGPVTVARAVHEAMTATPVSHRAEKFFDALRSVKRALTALTKARHVAVLLGSGTLANDMVAAQLKRNSGRGIVLSNGEFGNRLIDHAKRHQLSFETIHLEWGQPFGVDDIVRKLDAAGDLKWLWMTHCETSTGVLNDIVAIGALCRARAISLCLDCISSLGIVPIDLSEVRFASSASGKGLAAYPGLSMVFHNHTVSPSSAVPCYLDLGLYGSNTEADSLDGETPFTHSSNLVEALDAALKNVDWSQKFLQVSRDGSAVQRALRQAGFRVVAEPVYAVPGVLTIALPATANSLLVGEAMDVAGFLLSYRSGYLRERNWIQICLMGNYEQAMLDAVVAKLRHVVRPMMLH